MNCYIYGDQRYDQWYDSTMRYAKVAISIDAALLKRVDHLVKSGKFASRSEAFQAAVREKIARLDKTRLASECAKLSKKEEQLMADQGLKKDLETWPAY